jgi:archaellum component FlaC|tara:strand:- start:568 stop:780 length:213 start_codon:yes stop_codon:yes gene_type:complete
MVGKADQILDYIIEIKTDIGGIKQHLKDINGNVDRHDREIKGIKKKVAYVSGVIATIGAGIGIFLNKVLN